MAGSVSFETKEWDNFIKQVDANVKDPKPLLKLAFNTAGFRDVIKHFQGEQSPEGTWKKSKRAIEQGGQTLQDTGRLRGGFQPGNIKNQGKNAIVFFNPVPYGGIHDEGTKTIPQREFMWLSDSAQEEMLNIMLDQLVK